MSGSKKMLNGELGRQLVKNLVTGIYLLVIERN